MSFHQTILFNIEFSANPWQIVRNKDGMLIIHDRSHRLDIFGDSSNALNVSSYTIKWIPDKFTDKYMTFIQQYLTDGGSCWKKGTFISDSLVSTGGRLVLTQNRLFDSRSTDSDCASESFILNSQKVFGSESSPLTVSLDHGRGFHRKFRIIKRTHEEIGLLFFITRDAYIDSFDPNLLALLQYGSYNIYGAIDLEAAAYDENAKLHILEMNLKSEFIGELEVPFHLRYQKPVAGGTYQEIKLPHPLVIVQKDSKSLFEFPADLFNNSSFSIYHEDDDWTISIPIGNTNDLNWMPISTIVVLFLAILLVVTAVPRSKLKSKKTQ